MSIGLFLSSLGLGAQTAGGLPLIVNELFTTDEAAPVTAPRSAEPGPGTWTIAQSVNNPFSISGGQWLLAAPANPASEHARIAITRTPGTAYAFRIGNSGGTKRYRVGWHTTDAATEPVMALYADTSAYLPSYTTNIFSQSLSAQYNTFVLVLRAIGMFVYEYSGGAPSLRYVVNTGSANPMYAHLAKGAGGGASGTVEQQFARIAILNAFSDDYAIATNRLSGTRSAGDTIEHTADCILEFTVDTLPTVGTIDYHFRIQDSTNYWQLQINSAGDLTLNEVASGTPTARDTAAAVITAGERLQIRLIGTAIDVYDANARRVNYTSSTYQTETNAELDAIGTGGAVSDMVAWPNRLTGTALSEITQLAVV